MQIFVSYRRGLTTDITGRLDDRLRQHFGEEAVFRDVDNIPPGVDFHVYLDEAVAKSQIFLVVLGPDWLSAGDLKSENDFVRIELEAALRRELPVIPVLVQNAPMPQSSELPDALKPLLRRQALKVDSGVDFDVHAQRLIRGIESVQQRLEARGKQQAEKEPHRLDELRRQVRAAEASKAFVHEPSGCELVFVPGGEFMMGSPDIKERREKWEGPAHRVTVQPFYLGRYPVTNEQYGRYLSATGAKKPPYWAHRNYSQPEQPIVGVSWHDAKRYAKWAKLRLPSEAQWEYACRAGTTTLYYSGDTQEDLGRVGWYGTNLRPPGLQPVGEKEPNAYGLYDMHGSVLEWCEDDWHEDYTGAPADGSAWVDRPRARERVLRGGSWLYDSPEDCRSAYRDRGTPVSRFNDGGFRVSLDSK